jgi:C4-dicarboxylate-specific signal transduction histidine kinase
MSNPLVFNSRKFGTCRNPVIGPLPLSAVRSHPDGQNVFINWHVPPAEADIDARSLESALLNLLLNACQAATQSTHVPQVKMDLTELDERIYVTILDNGPGIPASGGRCSIHL